MPFSLGLSRDETDTVIAAIIELYQVKQSADTGSDIQAVVDRYATDCQRIFDALKIAIVKWGDANSEIKARLSEGCRQLHDRWYEKNIQPYLDDPASPVVSPDRICNNEAVLHCLHEQAQEDWRAVHQDPRGRRRKLSVAEIKNIPGFLVATGQSSDLFSELSDPSKGDTLIANSLGLPSQTLWNEDAKKFADCEARQDYLDDLQLKSVAAAVFVCFHEDTLRQQLSLPGDDDALLLVIHTCWSLLNAWDPLAKESIQALYQLGELEKDRPILVFAQALRALLMSKSKGVGAGLPTVFERRQEMTAKHYSRYLFFSSPKKMSRSCSEGIVARGQSLPVARSHSDNTVASVMRSGSSDSDSRACSPLCRFNFEVDKTTMPHPLRLLSA